MRLGRPASLTLGGENRILPYSASPEEMGETLQKFCGGSIYTHEDELREGYLTLPYGARLGVAGEATDAALRGIRAVHSLALRIPRHVSGVAYRTALSWKRASIKYGILVVSPPGCGKTTFLKDLIVHLSSNPEAYRVAVVDTRGELNIEGRGALADVLTGYPKSRGMELALRCLNPQVIVCDEIGSEDVPSIEKVANSGVPLVASAHGGTWEEVKMRPGIGAFLDNGVFESIVQLGHDGQVFTREERMLCGSLSAPFA